MKNILLIGGSKGIGKPHQGGGAEGDLSISDGTVQHAVPASQQGKQGPGKDGGTDHIDCGHDDGDDDRMDQDGIGSFALS